MPVNSRAKELILREIGNLLVKDLGLKNPVKRILEQTRNERIARSNVGKMVY